MNRRFFMQWGGTLWGTFALTTASLFAQQINGTPGSPDAMVTFDGKQLPPPDMTFGGVINETAKDSKPYWPPRMVPPKTLALAPTFPRMPSTR